MIKRQDLSGQRFGKLTALEFAFTRKKHSYWKCICDCGNETVVECSSLKSGKSTSCGCKCITHHESTTRLYKIYRKMRERTEYKKSNRWKNYGGRGIKVTTSGNRIYIDVYVIIKYGVSINAVAESLKEAIKYKVEGFTGMIVDTVNVNVIGVKL